MLELHLKTVRYFQNHRVKIRDVSGELMNMPLGRNCLKADEKEEDERSGVKFAVKHVFKSRKLQKVHSMETELASVLQTMKQ